MAVWVGINLKYQIDNTYSIRPTINLIIKLNGSSNPIASAKVAKTILGQRIIEGDNSQRVNNIKLPKHIMALAVTELQAAPQ